MPTSQDSAFFAAQNDSSLIIARTIGKGRTLVIEELREAALVEKSAIDEALHSVFPSGPGEISAAALRPAEKVRLANGDEAKRMTTPAAVQKFIRESAEFATLQPGFFALASAKEGTGAPWLLAASSASAHGQVLSSLAELQIKPKRTTAASLHTAGALAAALKARSNDAPVLCLDFGALESHALLVSRRGVEAAGSAAVSLDAIAEAVQGELGLKFKGSAGKLFFNELYDFSEAGPKIAARLAPAVKAGISTLGGTAPTELYCAGLPAKQQWLANLLAAELGLVSYAPDMKSWCSSLGIGFANPVIESGLSSAWLGFLHFVHVQAGGAPGSVWSTEWISFDAVLAAPTPAPFPVVAPAPAAPVPVAKPAPVAAPVVPPKAAPVAATPPPPAPKPAPAPAGKPAPAPAKPAASVNYPAKPTPTPAKPSSPSKAPAPAPAKPQPTPQPAKVAAAVPVTVAAPSRERPAGKSKMGLFIGIAAVIAVLVGGYLFMQSKNAETERIAKIARDDLAVKEKQIKEEADKVRIAAEQKARDEAEARKKTEIEFSQKLAASESARQQAEANAKLQAAARLANARGTLVIRTEPAGAMVTAGDLPARPSPATFSDIKIGKYPVTISLLNHDPVKLDAEVTENSTTEPPLVHLARITGSIEVASDPAGARYEVRPANVLLVPPDARRTGQTPATLNDLTPGDYSVSITRDGWPTHTENVTVGRNTSAKVAWAFQNGVVKISSSPDGATVTRNGTRLGVTPLTLAEQTPGDVRFELSLAQYEPATVSGRIESGKTLSLSVPLLSVDRLASLSELDNKPELIASSRLQPEIPVALVDKGGRVEIELTVTPTGAVKDATVLQSTNPALDPVCLAAAAKLRFKPGTINGKPMNVRVRIPYVFTASK